MNEFLGNIGKTVGQTTKKALKVSGDMLELTKTSMNIHFDEAKKGNFYQEIGKVIYNKYRTNPDLADADILDFCKCIDEINSTIAAQKAQVAKIKKQKFCVACGQKLDLSVVYCFVCGEKQPEIPVEEEEECCCCDDDCCDEDDCCCENEECGCESDCDCGEEPPKEDCGCGCDCQ